MLSSLCNERSSTYKNFVENYIHPPTASNITIVLDNTNSRTFFRDAVLTSLNKQ